MTTRSTPMPVAADPPDVLRRASDALARGVDVCVATVVGHEGSAPSTGGQKLVVCTDQTAAGTVGGGAVERAIMERMVELLRLGAGRPELQSFTLSKDLGMSCGGRVQVLLEPIFASTPVLLVGAGHIGLALARLLVTLQFRVVLVDERESAIDPRRWEGVSGLDARRGVATEVAQELPRRAAVVVATHGHATDEAAVAWAVGQGFSFVGGVGSRSKSTKIRASLAAKGLPEERVAAMRMPVGLGIGARTPQEIALSIAAELVAWRAGESLPAAKE